MWLDPNLEAVFLEVLPVEMAKIDPNNPKDPNMP